MVSPQRVGALVLAASAIVITGLGIESSNRPAGDASSSTFFIETMQTSRAEAETEPIFGAEVPIGIDPVRELPQLPLPPRPKVVPQRQARVVFTGDMIPHGPVTRQAQAYGRGSGQQFDFDPMFAEVAPIIRQADLALCHMETPLSSTNTRLGGYPVFNAPHELAEAVAGAGYDGCSLASNHSFDRGESGVLDTAAVLDANGLGFAGIARDSDEAATATTYDVNGITFAHLSFTYGLNGFRLPPAKSYLVDLIDADLIEARAQQARKAGADVVIVSMHWGAEYVAAPSSSQTALAERLRENSNIDLIVGHHSHVVQPIDTGGSGTDVVVYGLGNFLSNQSADCCLRSTQDGVIVEVLFEERRDGTYGVAGGCVVPTWVDRSDFVILPAEGSRRIAPDDSVKRTRETLGQLGAYKPGFPRFRKRCA